MPVQTGEITNILLLLQGQHQCVLVALVKTVSRFTHNCTHIHPAPAHRVSYLHRLVLPCEAGTNFTYTPHTPDTNYSNSSPLVDATDHCSPKTPDTQTDSFPASSP